MTGWNPQLTRLRRQLAQVALTPGADLAERSAAALEALGRVLPFDAAWLAVRDPEARRHTPAGTAGAPGGPPRARGRPASRPAAPRGPPRRSLPPPPPGPPRRCWPARSPCPC